MWRGDDYVANEGAKMALNVKIFEMQFLKYLGCLGIRVDSADVSRGWGSTVLELYQNLKKK